MRHITKLASAILLSLTVSASAFAQYSSSGYFLKDNFQSNMLNPALTPEHGYILLPGIGGSGLNISSNTLSIDKMLYPNPNGSGLVPFFDIDIDKTPLLNSLDKCNYVNADISTTIFGIGFYSKNNVFWNFGVNARAAADITIPKEAFELVALNQNNNTYSLQDLSASSSSYIETYLGASFPLSKRLSFGVRAKFLMGFYDVNIDFDNFDVTLNDSEWKISSSGMFSASLMGLSLKESAEDFRFDALEFTPEIEVMGVGAALDLGFNYDIIDNLSLSLAVTDLGFINWNGSKTIAAEASSDYTFEGYNSSDEDSLSDFDIDELLQFETIEAQDCTKSLKTNINAAAEYRFLNDKMAAGVLYTANFRSNYTRNEITTLLSLRPVKCLTANVSYSFIGKQVGAALNLHTNWINFFVGADYLPKSVTPQYIPINAKNFSFFTGVSIPLTSRK